MVACDNHSNFDWSCSDCKNSRQRLYEEDNKKIIVCKYCKKEMNSKSYYYHRKTKAHIAIRKLHKIMKKESNKN